MDDVEPEKETTKTSDVVIILAGLTTIIGALAIAGPLEVNAGAGITGGQANAIDGTYIAVGGGEYQVGEGPGMLAPGLYRAQVPADSIGCWWETKSVLGERTARYADSHTTVDVDIDETTVTFRTGQCGVWKRQ